MKPAIILYILLIAIILTSANATGTNQPALKLSPISPGMIPATTPPEDIPLKVKETI